MRERKIERKRETVRVEEGKRMISKIRERKRRGKSTRKRVCEEEA